MSTLLFWGEVQQELPFNIERGTIMPSRSGDAETLNRANDLRRRALTQGAGHGITLGNFRIAGDPLEPSTCAKTYPPPQEKVKQQQG